MRNVPNTPDGVKATQRWERTRTVAERAGVSDNTVRNWCQTGAISAIKVGGTWLVPEGELERISAAGNVAD